MDPIKQHRFQQLHIHTRTHVHFCPVSVTAFVQSVLDVD